MSILWRLRGAKLDVQSEDFYLYFMLTYLRVAWEILNEND